MNEKNPSPLPPGEPIVLRINLHIHDLSGKITRVPGSVARARSPGVVNPPRHLPKTPPSAPRLEGALDRNRLTELIAAGSPPAAPPALEPDIEVTLVLHV